MAATLGQVTTANPRVQETPGPWGLSKYGDIRMPSDVYLLKYFECFNGMNDGAGPGGNCQVPSPADTQWPSSNGRLPVAFTTWQEVGGRKGRLSWG